jgi:fumarate hydratase subunit beta
MEALHLIKVDKYPAIIGAAHGKSIYTQEEQSK